MSEYKTDISVEQLKDLAHQLKEMDEKVEETKERHNKELKAVKAPYLKLEQTIIGYLNTLKITKDAFPCGDFTIKIANHEDIRITDKFQLFDYLKELELFEDYASVHAGKAKTFYKDQREKAKKEGNYQFQVPGMSLVGNFQTIKFGKSKAKKG